MKHFNQKALSVLAVILGVSACAEPVSQSQSVTTGTAPSSTQNTTSQSSNPSSSTRTFKGQYQVNGVTCDFTLEVDPDRQTTEQRSQSGTSLMDIRFTGSGSASQCLGKTVASQLKDKRFYSMYNRQCQPDPSGSGAYGLVYVTQPMYLWSTSTPVVIEWTVWVRSPNGQFPCSSSATSVVPDYSLPSPNQPSMQFLACGPGSSLQDGSTCLNVLSEYSSMPAKFLTLRPQ